MIMDLGGSDHLITTITSEKNTKTKITHVKSESFWYRFHQILTLSMFVAHTLVSAILVLMMVSSIFFKRFYSICSTQSDFSFTIFTAVNITLAGLFYFNWDKAKEMDIVLLKRTRNLVVILVLTAPLMYVGLWMPQICCRGERDHVSALDAVLYYIGFTVVEGCFLCTYFSMYYKHVVNKALFTRPYDTGLRLE